MGLNIIRSGQIEGGTNTPSGAPIQVAVDNPYLTKDDFIKFPFAKGLGITASSPEYSDGSLDWVLLEASAEVNRICRRYFDTQTIDEQKTGFRAQPYNPQLTTIVLNNRPYRHINSIYIQVLKWFIQVDTTPSGYLQDFPVQGFYRIVPLLSTSGQGAGSPIPAAILDKVALGVIWTNYTFGYGTTMTSQSTVGDATFKIYQVPVGKRLMAPSQTVVVYDNSVVVPSSGYTIDYPNGIITFTTARTSGSVITVDYISNESVPFDIRRATAYLAADVIGQGGSNPLGANSLSIQTYSVSFSDGHGKLYDKAMEILGPFISKMPKII
jgi:hypothetical protein